MSNNGFPAYFLAVHPVAFNLGSFAIHWYGVMVALGFLFGLWNASRRAMKAGLPPERIFDIGPWLIVGGIVGGRILHVITYWEQHFASKPLWEIFAIHHGGLVYYGGLIGAIACGIFYLRWKKLPVWKVGDVLAPSLALGYAIGRFGCLMNGCCFGKTCDLPWAIHYPRSHETHGLPVHPTQVYDSLLNFGIFIAMALFFPKRRFDGQVFAVYLMCYAAARSFVEIFRGDYAPQYLFGALTPAHLISIAIFTAGALLYWKLPRAKKTS